MKLLFSLFLFPLLILYPSLLLGGYMPENTPPKSLGKNSRVFEDILFEIGTATKAKIVFGSQTVTGNGTSGRIGTSTGLPQIEYDYNGGSPFVNFKDFIGGIKVDGVGIINTTTYLKSWTADNKTGTGTFSILSGSGIQVTSTYNGSVGVGTITLTAVGTPTSGGWTDAGTQTISNLGYNIKINGGKLDLTNSTGVLGLVDTDVPNTITIDNLTQITNRPFTDMQGILSLGTQSNKSVVIPDIQIGGSVVGTDTTELNFANDVFIGSVTGAAQTTLSLKSELKGTTSATAGYLVKLDGSGKIGTSTLPAPPAFGSYVIKNADTEYQAATDGFVLATIYADNNGDIGYIRALVDSTSPPTTQRMVDSVCYRSTPGNETDVYYGTLCVPVKKNDYWLINVNNLGGSIIVTIYWMPLQ